MKLDERFEHTLLELKCNVHPLDSISTDIRGAFKKYDKEQNIESSTFGNDCRVGNLIYGLTKMRYKQGKGDPAGFKHFLHQENIKPGVIVHYVGNRFHVLFYLSGIFFQLKDKLLNYLQIMCLNNTTLRTSLIKDLQNNGILIQLRVLGLIGKVITGPWMKIFYCNNEGKSNLEVVSILKASVNRLQYLVNTPELFLTTSEDLFAEKLNENDETLKCLQSEIPPLEKEQFNILMTMALQCVLDVLQRQLEPYLTGTLSNPTEEMLSRSQGAPIHNMHSEQTLALTDHQIRRARNATIGFVDGKVKSKRNRTLQWLEEKNKHSQEKLISFAIGRARYARQQQKANDNLRLEIEHARLMHKQQKRDKTSRSKTEKNFRDVILKKCNVNEIFPDLETGIAEVVNTVLENPNWLNGKDVTHMWNISPGQDKEFSGKVLNVKNSKKGIKVIISYWSAHELEEESEDNTLTLDKVLADIVHHDLVIH